MTDDDSNDCCKNTTDISMFTLYCTLRGLTAAVTLFASEMTQSFPTYEGFYSGCCYTS